MLCFMMVFFAVLGGYILTSVFLFKYPNFLHPKKEQRFKCRHISHRGGAGENYENTIAAFQHAVAVGTDMLELDCHLTRDGHVVVSHDHNLFRTTGVNKNITDLNYTELPLLYAKVPIDFEPGQLFEGSGRPEERKIPLLREVFQKFTDIPVNIDIKMDDDGLIRAVNDLVKEFKREEITVWGNFSDAITKKCYLENPNIRLLFSFRRVVHLVLLMYSGLLPFTPLRETHLEIFLPSIYRRKSFGKAGNYLPLQQFIIWSMDFLLMRKSLFEHLEKRGIHTYIWVLNSEEEFREAFDHGVTGIMTDYPTRLRFFLKENPKYQ